MAFDLIAKFGQRFLQPIGGGFGARASVGENQRGAILLHESSQLMNEPLSRVAAGWVRIFAERRVNAQVHFLCRAHVHDFAGAMRPD
jgi:hypothetical protein